MVVDASAIVEALLQGPRGKLVERLVLGANLTLQAPHLLDIEVAHTLRRQTIAGRIDSLRGWQAIQDLSSLPVVRYPQGMLLPRVWELRNNLTAYDAAYVALAEILDVPLLTCDSRLASAPGHSARIELV